MTESTESDVQNVLDAIPLLGECYDSIMSAFGNFLEELAEMWKNLPPEMRAELEKRFKE